MGPNTGKTPVMQAFCIARALTAYTAQSLDRHFETQIKVIELIKNHGPIAGWIKIATDDFDRYVKATSISAGYSQPTLPEGETIDFVIDVRGANSISRAFREFVGNYQRGAVTANVFSWLAHGDTSNIAYNKQPDLETAEKLTRTLGAIESEYNERQIQQFRDWLHSLPGTSVPNEPDLLIVAPDHLLNFTTHLSQEREEKWADACLYGSVAAATEICIELAVPESPANDLQSLLHFNKLAGVLTFGPKLHPVSILHGTADQAITEGLAQGLLELADSYREKAKEKVEEALRSGNLDDHLDRLYEATPRVHAALIIYKRILIRKNDVDTRLYRRANGAYYEVEELQTRLQVPFAFQILDFYNGIWTAHIAAVRAAWRKDGEKAAKEFVRTLVERHLMYPRVLTSSLLDESRIN